MRCCMETKKVQVGVIDKIFHWLCLHDASSWSLSGSELRSKQWIVRFEAAYEKVDNVSPQIQQITT